MKHGAEQKIRLLLLYEILQEQTDEEHTLSTQELMTQLKDKGVPIVRQTLYEDIAMLNEYGYEVLCEKVNKNNRYYVVNRKFDRSEIQVLLQAVNAAKFLTTNKTKNLTKKLLSLLGTTEAEQLQEVSVIRQNKRDNERIYYIIDAITTAITEHKQISFLYFDTFLNGERIYRKDKARYIVNPLGIVNSEDNLYLVCYSDRYGNAVTYRIDRMDEVYIEEKEIINLPQYDNFEVAAFTNERFAMYGGESQEVELTFSQDLAEIAIERFGGNDLTVKNGSCFVKAKVQISRPFFAWIAMFEGRVKILSPKNIIRRYKEFLQNNQKEVSSQL